MRLQLGSLDIRIGKGANVPDVTYPPAGKITTLPPTNREPFSGAWQRGISVPMGDALDHPTFWACVTLIASDIAKCGFFLAAKDKNGILTPAESPSFSPVLRKPNYYQTRLQFYASWSQSLDTRGNFYALKERDGKGSVVALYPLNPDRVRVAVSPSGDVFYALGQDLLAGVSEASAVVPAREIIHDRINTFYHPLCGLPPIYAAGSVIARGRQVIENSTKLAARGFQIGGIITSPDVISPENAAKFEEMWQAQYAGPQNAGKIVVLGGGLKYEEPPAMTGVEAQIVEQLGWDDKKICGILHVPAFMVEAGDPPAYNNVDSLLQQYYSQAIQVRAEGMELSLEEGLGTNVGATDYEVEFDKDALLDMDSAAKLERAEKGRKAGILTINEARKIFNLPPVKGGDTVYLQEQEHSLAAIAERDAGPDPFGKAKAPAAAAPAAPPPTPPKAKSLDDLDDRLVLAAALAEVA